MPARTTRSLALGDPHPVLQYSNLRRYGTLVLRLEEIPYSVLQDSAPWASCRCFRTRQVSVGPMLHVRTSFLRLVATYCPDLPLMDHRVPTCPFL